MVETRRIYVLPLWIASIRFGSTRTWAFPSRTSCSIREGGRLCAIRPRHKSTSSSHPKRTTTLVQTIYTLLKHLKMEMSQYSFSKNASSSKQQATLSLSLSLFLHELMWPLSVIYVRRMFCDRLLLLSKRDSRNTRRILADKVFGALKICIQFPHQRHHYSSRVLKRCHIITPFPYIKALVNIPWTFFFLLFCYREEVCYRFQKQFSKIPFQHNLVKLYHFVSTTFKVVLNNVSYLLYYLKF